ncbi:MAG: hypothetical protein KAJ03_01605 [Gammaproteobacteria bacterium]|nr:hypothetical protein [Gammaproteobacteria bacterium]
MSDEIYICTAAHHCDEARDNGCDHSGFHERIHGECVGNCTQDDSAECVKASTYNNPDEIAAFESLVDAYVVPDAELSPSGTELRKKLGDAVCTMHRRVVDNRIAVAKKRLEEQR